MDQKKNFIDYWRWFFIGSGNKPGFFRIVNWWLLFHIGIGFGLSFVVGEDLVDNAKSVLLPLVGVLVGLSFAWAGNAQALLQTKEIEKLAKFHKGGLAEYVYVYQTAILIILVTLIVWGLAGMKVFDQFWPTKNSIFYPGVKIMVFSLLSISLRECWHVVLGAQWMLLVQKDIKNSLNKPDKNKKK